ncbi:DUF502 domain-containing protein [Aliiroseovarius sp.]|uniref:DUF502 domain-containing protein n=1 Tax=Aliiroseovarius sp. TaxID=1872442 RepID=UPI003BA97ABB
MDEHEPHHRRRWRPFSGLRNNFLAGLVVVVPIAITMWMIWTFVGWIDSWVLPFVPGAYHPDELINRFFGDKEWFKWIFGEEEVHVNVRGVGVVLFLLFTVLVGWVTKGLIGRSFLHWAEGLVDRMPVVRSLYNGIKQIAETVFAQTETKFDKACLVEYPRKGIWAIAFVSTNAKGEIDQRIPVDEPVISVFLPTTPNPTSGFLLFVPQHSVIMLDMSVEDAAKLVISAGLVYPNPKDPSQPNGIMGK